MEEGSTQLDVPTPPTGGTEELLKAIGALAGGSLLGKAVGLVREILLAGLFGTSATVVAFRVSQTATLIPVNFFTSDTLNAGFIPLYSRYLEEDETRAAAFFGTICVLLGVISAVLCIALYFAAPAWVGVLAPGLDPQTTRTTIGFVRVMALGVPFVVLGALVCYLEMANGRYRLASFRAAAQSVGIIAGTGAAYWTARPVLLAWGFTGAYAAFSLLAIGLLGRRGLLLWPKRWVWWETRLVLGALWRTVRPLLLLPFLLQGNIALERAIASLIGAQTVAGLDYARFITETGMVVLAVPTGLAGLSSFSRIPIEELAERLRQIVPVLLLLTFPASAFLAANSRAIVSTLYSRGAFDAQSVAVTASVLTGLSFGFWAHVCAYPLIKFLNAQLRNREALLFVALALGVNAISNLALFRLLGPLALGLSFSLNGVVLLVLTVRAFRLGTCVLSYLLWLVPGGALSLAATSAIPRGTPLDLVFHAVVFAVFWAVYILAVPSLRSTVVYAWRRISPRGAGC